MIGKMIRYKLVGGFDSPPLVPDPDGVYLKLEELMDLELQPGEGLVDAVMRHISEHSGKKNKLNGVSFNDAMQHLIAYTLRLYLGEEEIVDGSNRDKKGEFLFNSIKQRARRFPEDDRRAQYIAGMERCLEILKGG